MTTMADAIFLFDVDNTLVDNDRIQADLGEHLAKYYSETTRARYWEIFEALREEFGFADYFGALERYRLESLHNPKLLRIANWLVDYPFRDRLYPNALAVVTKARLAGVPVILSDGDAVH